MGLLQKLGINSWSMTQADEQCFRENALYCQPGASVLARSTKQLILPTVVSCSFTDNLIELMCSYYLPFLYGDKDYLPDSLSAAYQSLMTHDPVLEKYVSEVVRYQKLSLTNMRSEKPSRDQIEYVYHDAYGRLLDDGIPEELLRELIKSDYRVPGNVLKDILVYSMFPYSDQDTNRFRFLDSMDIDDLLRTHGDSLDEYLFCVIAYPGKYLLDYLNDTAIMCS